MNGADPGTASPTSETFRKWIEGDTSLAFCNCLTDAIPVIRYGEKMTLFLFKTYDNILPDKLWLVAIIIWHYISYDSA